jgi:hypothetical protein
MKKQLKKIVLLAATLTLFSFLSYSREIGKIISGVPVVTLTQLI